jgi:nucleotide-binding universal stress UspA family protein
MSIGNVIVGVDFTSITAGVLARAAWLPVGRDYAITLAHVVPPRLPQHLTDGCRVAAESRLRELRQTLAKARERAQATEVALFTAVLTGSAAEALSSYASDARAEIVVVGAGDATTRRARGVGSTAERVIRAAETSVLVVNGPAEGPYARPLVAVDLSPISRLVIGAARNIADQARQFELLHAHQAGYLHELRHAAIGAGTIDDFIASTVRAASEELGQLAAQAPPDATWRTILEQGDARSLILEQAARHQSDLLVVGARGHSALRHLLLGSVAEAVVRAGICDVLVAR